jgi:5-methylcytosine-specific restriction enzyme A
MAFYSSAAWQKARDAHLRCEPLCRRCGQHDIVRLADMVDHVLPIASGGERLEPSNLQSLCNPCHGAKTREDRRRYPSVYPVAGQGGGGG